MQKIIENKGITLVALVVTIIILLILAGVTISTALGQNGLFQRAKYAGEEYKNSEEKEQLALEDISKEIDKISADKAGTNEELPKNWNKEIVSAIADGEGGVIPLPKDFYYAGGSISTGIVISDAEKDDLNNSQKGNQFVWIPCTKEKYEIAGLYSSKDNKNSKNWPQLAYHTDSTSSSNTDAKYYAKIGWENPEYQITDAKRSIEIYGGFYVARFEAGVPEDANFYVSSSEDGDKTYYKKERKNVNTYKPVSKKNSQAWNYISQENAKKVSEEMYANSLSVNSYLMDSNAWNYICGNIFEKILINRGESLLKSSNYGNYFDNIKTNYANITGLYALHIWKNKGWNPYASNYTYGKIGEGIAPKGEGENRLELSTGCSDDFKIYNIFDMAGNMFEWTAETTTVKAGVNGETSEQTYAVLRGGYFNDTGINYSIVSSTGMRYATESSVIFGFRPLLYIN